MRHIKRRARLKAARTTAVLIGLTGTMAAACGGDRAEDAGEQTAAAARPDYENMSFPYEFEPAQKRAVGRYLERLDGWRLAVTTDNTNQLLGRMKRDQPGYQPYFAEGDITGDGKEDFALVLTNGSGAFRVVWFRSTGSAYGPPQPVANVAWLDQAGLFVQDGDLLVGEFDTDRSQRYRWNAEARRLERR